MKAQQGGGAGKVRREALSPGGAPETPAWARNVGLWSKTHLAGPCCTVVDRGLEASSSLKQKLPAAQGFCENDMK